MNQFCIFLIVVGVVIGSIDTAQGSGFRYADCGPANRDIKLYSLNVSPSPFHMPGNISLSFHGQNERTLTATDITFLFTRHTGFLISFPIPCIFNMGSCTYDLCTALDVLETQNYLGVSGSMAGELKRMFLSQGVVMRCPIQPSIVNVNNFQMSLPQLSSVLSFFLSGDYTLRLTYTDRDRGNAVQGCFTMDFSLD